MIADIMRGERDLADVFFLLALIAAGLAAIASARPVVGTSPAARVPWGSVLLCVSVALLSFAWMAL
ncbi:MAG TPA: hypothetical protein VIX41_06460 [Acidimicrobiales bacterium]